MTAQISPIHKSAKRFITPYWIPLMIVLCAMAGIIWLTLGLKANVLYEDWNFFGATLRGVSPFDASLNDGFHTRFLAEIPAWIGYIFTPNSFVGFNMFNEILFILQGIIIFAILRRLRPQNIVFAFAVAILYSVYPADNSLANNRYVGYHWSVVFFLLSVYFLVMYWQHPSRLLVIGIFIANILNLGCVETSYPIVLIMPLLLIQMEPRHRVTSRVIRVSLLWYMAPVLMLLDVIVVFAQGHAVYQSFLIGVSNQMPLPAHLLNYVQALLNAYWRVLVDCWQLAIIRLDPAGSRFIATAAITVLFGLCALFVVYLRSIRPLKSNSGTDRLTTLIRSGHQYGTIASDWTWLVIGVIVLGLGFAIYGYLLTHQNFTERVYYFPELGGALIFPILFGWLGRLFRRESLIVIVGTAVLVGLGFQSGLLDTLQARNASEVEQSVLADVARQAPDLGNTKLLLILDPTHQLSGSMIFAMYQYPNVLEPALHYFYNTASFDVRVCDPTTADPAFISLTCRLNSSDIHFPNSSDQSGNQIPDAVYPLEKVVAFTYVGEGHLTLLTTWPIAGATTYNPSRLLNSAAPPPLRAYTMLARWPFQMQTPLNDHPVHRVNFDQSSLVLQIDQPTLPNINYGWTGNWTSVTRSSFVLWLNPDSDYQLRVSVINSILSDTLNHITLSVNGQAIPLTTIPITGKTLTLTATIPQSVIAQDRTQTLVTFNSYPILSPLTAHLAPDSHVLGFQIDQFSLNAVAH